MFFIEILPGVETYRNYWRDCFIRAMAEGYREWPCRSYSEQTTEYARKVKDAMAGEWGYNPP